jgi:general stress protein 26
MAIDTQKHLYELIKDFDEAMLVTRTGNGALHARPMAVAELKPDADAYFATSIDSPKIVEIEAEPQALITFQDSSRFASINGKAVVVRDRAKIDALWSEAWRMWFPKGKDDPTLCLLKIEAISGEYWDNSGAKGLRYAFEGVKALLQGDRPAIDERQHAKVKVA